MSSGRAEASSSGEGSENKSPLEGLRVVILGAGGSARALAFGAQSRGADVVIANRHFPPLSVRIYSCL